MCTSTEDLQRTAWRELYEMLSAEIEPIAGTRNCTATAETAAANDEYIDGL